MTGKSDEQSFDLAISAERLGLDPAREEEVPVVTARRVAPATRTGRASYVINLPEKAATVDLWNGRDADDPARLARIAKDLLTAPRADEIPTEATP